MRTFYSRLLLSLWETERTAELKVCEQQPDCVSHTISGLPQRSEAAMTTEDSPDDVTDPDATGSPFLLFNLNSPDAFLMFVASNCV